MVKNLVFNERFEDIKADANVDSLKGYIIENLIKSSTSNEGDIVDHLQLQEAVEGCKLHSNIADSSTQISIFCADVFDRLEAARLADFRSDDPR